MTEWYVSIVCILHATICTLWGQLQYVLKVKSKIMWFGTHPAWHMQDAIRQTEVGPICQREWTVSSAGSRRVPTAVKDEVCNQEAVWRETDRLSSADRQTDSMRITKLNVHPRLFIWRPKRTEINEHWLHALKDKTQFWPKQEVKMCRDLTWNLQDIRFSSAGRFTHKLFCCMKMSYFVGAGLHFVLFYSPVVTVMIMIIIYMYEEEKKKPLLSCGWCLCWGESDWQDKIGNFLNLHSKELLWFSFF